MTYAGQALTLPTQEYIPLLQRWWDEQAPDLWQHPGYNLEELHYLPVPDRPKQRRARLNVLYWPSGASRWGIFHGLVDGTSLTAIQSATGGTISTPVAANLVLSDPDSVPITASMYMVAARPVFTLGSRQQYWITLVDKRYYAWLKQLTYTFSPGDSWATLIGNLSTAAGLPSPTVSTVAADYGAPDEDRWLDALGDPVQRPLPLLLDAACQQVGLRYALALDGATSKALNYTDAAVIDLANYNNNTASVYAGGRNTALNIIGNVPANVSVSFWSATTTATIVNKTLASLALSQYTGLTGVSGAYGFFGMDQEDTVVSPTQANAATQAATDYYLWLLSLNDVVFRSIRTVASSGLEDYIEWEYVPVTFGSIQEKNPLPDTLRRPQPAQIKTRIVPLNWSDKNIYGFAAPSGSSPPPPPPVLPWALLTETSGPSSWQGRYVAIPSGVWGNSSDSGTNDIRPCQMDGATFLPKPTADVLIFDSYWSGDINSGPAYLPIQAANRVSSVDYPGYVSTSAQLWNGTKTFDNTVIVGVTNGSFTVLGSSAAFFNVTGTPFSGVGISYGGSIGIGGGSAGQAYIQGYGQTVMTMAHSVGSIHTAFQYYITNGVTQGDMSYWQDGAGVCYFTLTQGANSVDLMCNAADTLQLIGASGTYRAANGVFDSVCYADLFQTYDVSVGIKSGGTVADGMGDFIFLNGLYIAGGVSGSFP